MTEFQINWIQEHNNKESIINYFMCSNRVNPNLKCDDVINHIIKIFSIDFKSISECKYFIQNNLKEIPKCYCGKYNNYIGNTRGYSLTCSKSCSSKLKKSPFNNLKTQEKATKTLQKKYGGRGLKSKIIKEKVEKTNLDNYGYINVFESPDIKLKIKNTMDTKYGSWYSKTEEFKDILTIKHREHINNYNELNKEFLLSTFVTKKGFFDIDSACEYFNCSYSFLIKFKEKENITIKNKINKTRQQQEIYEFIYNLIPNETIIYNDRKTIDNLELDIYIPSYNLAIEFDGLMYHSFGKSTVSKFNNYNSINAHYHKIKTELCEEQGIKLFHVFENEWKEKKEIWKSIISSNLGLNNRIFARKCEIRELNNKDYKIFIEENHLQGYVSAKYKYGLYFENELVSCMSFSKSRFNKNYEYELIRFCNKINTNVIGGASKLLKVFDKKSIISYANRRISNGNLYNAIGFKQMGNTAPNYFYFRPNDNVLYSRHTFKRHLLTGEGTETSIMFDNGYRKIFDSGNLVYIKEK